jgi:hypothetical protein
VSTEPGVAQSAKPAIEVSTGSSPSISACEVHREFIESSQAKGHNAMAIWQDLVDQYGFSHAYASVRRFVSKLRPGDANGSLRDHHHGTRAKKRKWTTAAARGFQVSIEADVTLSSAVRELTTSVSAHRSSELSAGRIHNAAK